MYDSYTFLKASRGANREAARPPPGRSPRRPDGDHQDLSLNAAWLREALDAVLAGSEPDGSETEPVGCSIKWKR